MPVTFRLPRLSADADGRRRRRGELGRPGPGTGAGKVAGVPPPLVTERLVLRPLQPQDGAALWEQWNDPLVWRYVGAGVLPSRERIERGAALLGRMYLERGWSGLLVSRRSDGRVLGECGLYPWRQEGRETGQVELGYRFGREHWGQGYAGEAARGCWTGRAGSWGSPSWCAWCRRRTPPAGGSLKGSASACRTPGTMTSAACSSTIAGISGPPRLITVLDRARGLKRWPTTSRPDE